MFMFTAGCGVSPAMLTSSEGTFGITKAQYENSLRCRWNIQVGITKVSSLKEYIISTCRKETFLVVKGIGTLLSILCFIHF